MGGWRSSKRVLHILFAWLITRQDTPDSPYLISVHTSMYLILLQLTS